VYYIRKSNLALKIEKQITIQFDIVCQNKQYLYSFQANPIPIYAAKLFY
jgi:hypothetical protein